MKIIAFEGLDKAGKFTQVQKLVERLTKEGYKVARAEFHNYSSPTGELISKWLRKQWNVDQKTIELIMAADKQAQQPWFEQLEEEGYDFLVLDRYTLSQYVYGPISLVREGMSGIAAENWVRDLLQSVREPDFTLFIDIPAEVSMARKGKHNNGENDRYESDVKLLEGARNRYADQMDHYVDGVTVDGLKTPDEVHADIWSLIDHHVL